MKSLNFLNKIKKKKYLELFFHLIIISHCVILALDSINLSSKAIFWLTFMDFVCFILFVLELFVRIIQEGKKFIKKPINLLDIVLLIINICSIFNLAITKNIWPFSIEVAQYKPFIIIRALSVIRITRVLLSGFFFKSTAALLPEMINVLIETKSFLGLIGVFLFFMSLVGRDTFNFQENFDINSNPVEKELEKMSFFSFPRAFLSNIWVFFNEDWNITTSIYFRAFQTKRNLGFFIVNLLISIMFLNKFFLAFLINKLVESKKMKTLFKTKSRLDIFISNTKKSLKNIKKKIVNSLKHAKLRKIIDFFKIKNSFCGKFAEKILQNNKFKKFMLICSWISTFSLAFTDPFKSFDSFENNFLFYLDIVFLSIFLFEFLLTLVYQEKGQFLKKSLFLFILCFLYALNFLLKMPLLKLFMILRVFFIMNPYKSLKFVVSALVFSFSELLPLFSLYFLLIFAFAVVGTRLFKGELWQCEGLASNYYENITNKIQCFDYGGDWVNADFSFDNIPNAINLLFAIANSSGWLPLM